MTHHRIRFVKILDGRVQLFVGDSHDLRQFLVSSFPWGGIHEAAGQITDGDGETVHFLIKADENPSSASAAVWQGAFALLDGRGDDHFTHGRNPSGSKTCFGAAKADAFGAELVGDAASRGLSALVRTFRLLYLSAQSISVLKSPGRGVHRLDLFPIDFPGGAVKRDPVAFVVPLAPDFEIAGFGLTCTRRHRRRSRFPCRGRRPPHARSCRRETSARLGDDHTFDIFRARFPADENERTLVEFDEFGSAFGGEDDPTVAAPGDR